MHHKVNDNPKSILKWKRVGLQHVHAGLKQHVPFVRLPHRSTPKELLLSRVWRALLLSVALFQYSANAAWHEILLNNGFELGPVDWGSYSLNNGNPQSPGGVVNLGNAHAGSWYGYVGDESTSLYNATNVLRQYVTIPPYSTSILFSGYVNVTSLETTTIAEYDTMGLYLRTLQPDAVAIAFHKWSNLDKDPHGVKTNYNSYAFAGDVSAYQGEDMELQFYAQTDGALSTTFRIDDVSFQVYIPDYTVAVSAGANGNVTPSGNQTLEAGQTLKLSATPFPNFTADQWLVNGKVVQTGGSTLTLTDIQSSATVSVTFTAPLYNLTVQVSGSGSYTLTPPGGRYPPGTAITLTPVPEPQNQFSEWTGSQYSRNPMLSFAKGGADETIEVHFVPIFAPSTLAINTANSTPSTIGINIPTPASWIIQQEESSDLRFWTLVQAIIGQGSTTTIQLPTASPAGYVRTSASPIITTPPFLNFPVHNGDLPATVPISAICDHSGDPTVSKAYVKDGAIRTAQGVTFPILPENEVPGNYYAILPEGVQASTIFNYQGVANQGGQAWLQYDGHPGYDMLYGNGTDVYAAAGGVVMTDADLTGSNLAGTGLVSYYMTTLHALVINHGNGYCSVVMHLSDLDPAFVDKSNPDAWVPVKATVNAGDHVGVSGNFDSEANPALGPHLHFEVWRLDSGNIWRFADPYGYTVTNPDSSVTIITPVLWTGK